MTLDNAAALELADWRRRVAGPYAAVRADHDPERAHAGWRSARDALFRTHPQSPLPPGDPLRTTGLPCWDLRPRHAIGTAAAPGTGTSAAAGADGRRPDHDTAPHRQVTFPAPPDVTVDVWWLRQYGGGLFLPLRDGTAGDAS
jgi:hypothetical protein